MEAELEPHRLLETIVGAIRRGTFDHGDEEKDVYLTEKYVYISCPGALRKLCKRMGMGYGPALGDRMIESLERNSEVLRWEGVKSILVSFCPDGDSEVKEAGITLRRSKVFTDEELAGRALWPNDVTVYVESTGLLSEWEQHNRKNGYGLAS